MAFTDSSILIYDNALNTVVDFEELQATPLSLTLPSTYDGVTLDYVVSRPGYTKALGQFVGGGAINLTNTPIQVKDPDGTLAYTGTSSPNIAISFTFSPLRCFIDIGNASVSSQTIVDEIEDALSTEDGCRFLIETNGSTSIQAVLAGQTYLLLGQNYRLRRENALDVNASIDAYVISADGVPLDGTNGGVQFLTAQDVGSAVWNALLVNHLGSGSFGEFIQGRLQDLQTEINTNNSLIGGVDTLVGNIDSKVDIIDTNVDAIKAKTDTLVNTDLTGIATASNVTSAQSAIITEVNANEAKLDIIDSQVDLIKTKVDSLNNTDLTGIATTTNVTDAKNEIVSDIAEIKQNTDLIPATL